MTQPRDHDEINFNRKTILAYTYQGYMYMLQMHVILQCLAKNLLIYSVHVLLHVAFEIYVSTQCRIYSYALKIRNTCFYNRFTSNEMNIPPCNAGIGKGQFLLEACLMQECIIISRHERPRTRMIAIVVWMSSDWNEHRFKVSWWRLSGTKGTAAAMRCIEGESMARKSNY